MYLDSSPSFMFKKGDRIVHVGYNLFKEPIRGVIQSILIKPVGIDVYEFTIDGDGDDYIHELTVSEMEANYKLDIKRIREDKLKELGI